MNNNLDAVRKAKEIGTDKISDRTIIDLAWRNIQRWRWRLIVVAIILSFYLVIYFVYSSSLASVIANRLQYTEEVKLVYYDALMQRPQDEERMPQRITKLYNSRSLRNMGYYLDYYDAAVEFRASSSRGVIDILGISLKDRLSYQIQAEDFLQGRMIMQHGEIMLPKVLADDLNIMLGDKLLLHVISESQLRSQSYEVVGIYHDSSSYLTGQVIIEDALSLLAVTEENCYLVGKKGEADVATFISQLLIIYPDTHILHSATSFDMANSLQTSVQSSSSWILTLSFVFAGIAIFAVALMTFLERRKELATLKSVGIANKQVTLQYLIEYGSSELGGILVGGAIILIAVFNLPFFSNLTLAQLGSTALIALLGSCFILLLATLLPVASSVVASVNQLLNGATIPLWVRYLGQASDNTYSREKTNDSEIVLKLPEVNGVPDCLVLRHAGDTVKRGETIAVLESLGGLYVQKWLAPCDGIILDLDTGGYLVISKTVDKN